MTDVIVKLKRECFACPATWEGKTEAGEFVYIRYRHGFGYVAIAPTEDEIFTGKARHVCGWKNRDSDGDGFMTDWELRDELAKTDKVSLAEGVIPDECNCDEHELDIFGCEVCGKPPSEEAYHRWHANLNNMLKIVREDNQ